MIDIKQLHYFVTVADLEHVGRAAEMLNMTQPPLSRQILLLEQALGAALFVRHPKGVSLTSAGESFYKDAQRLLASLDQACQNVRDVAQGKTGKLLIGFMMHAAYSIVPKLTKNFMAAYPEVTLRLQEVIPSELMKRVQSGEFDAAIMLQPLDAQQGIGLIKLCESKLCLALPKGHSLAKKEDLSGNDLVHESFIATPFSVAPELRGALTGYGHQYGFEPKVILETQLQQSIINLVAEGLGLALIPEILTKVQFPGVAFRPLRNAPSVEYVMIWREDSLNPALPRLIETVKSDFSLE